MTLTKAEAIARKNIARTVRPRYLLGMTKERIAEHFYARGILWALGRGRAPKSFGAGVDK